MVCFVVYSHPVIWCVLVAGDSYVVISSVLLTGDTRVVIWCVLMEIHME